MKSDKQRIRVLKKEVKELRARLSGWGRPGKKLKSMEEIFKDMLPCKGVKIIAAAEKKGISYSTVMRARIRFEVDINGGVWKWK